MALHDYAIRLPPGSRKILMFPAVRLVVALIFFAAFTGFGLALAGWIARELLPGDQALPAAALQMFSGSLFCLAGYCIYCGLIEGRPVYELNIKKFAIQTGAGLLLGFGFISLIMTFIWIWGGYRIIGWNSAVVVLPVLIMSVQSGILEEILSRGILFRIIEEGTGTWLAMLFSALIFGFMHSWNLNATLFSSLSIALTAGVILALLYVVTRQLWIPIGLHIGWNFTLGGIFGAPVSGTPTNGLLRSQLTGEEWLTGGPFGPEASLVTICVFILFGLFLMRKIIRDQSWIKPMWRRQA